MLRLGSLLGELDIFCKKKQIMPLGYSRNNSPPSLIEPRSDQILTAFMAKPTRLENAWYLNDIETHMWLS